MKRELNFNSAQLKNLIQILTCNNHQARVIGGSVRDALLELTPKDLDIATTLTPGQVMKLLKSHNILTIPTGIKYGTVTAIIDREKFEITTLRKDIKCDGRRAIVKFTESFEEDALRRDFTINALSYCLSSKQVFDYFDGMRHLANKQVIFIGDPKQRIVEDHLRILRFFRFSAYYANKLDQNGLETCKHYAHLLQNLTRERINAEFDKILLAPGAVNILQIMQNANILTNIFPSIEISISLLGKVLQLKEKFNIATINLDELFSILICQNQNINFKLLKFSNNRQKAFINITNFINDLKKQDVVFILKKLWSEGKNVKLLLLLAVELKYLSFDQAKDLLEFFNSNPVPTFPISGKQLKELGYTGKDIGSVINYLKDIWVKNNFQLSAKGLMQCLKHYS
jgi:poly(A) polymerase